MFEVQKSRTNAYRTIAIWILLSTYISFRYMLDQVVRNGFTSPIYSVFFNVSLPNSSENCPDDAACHCAGNWYFFSQNRHHGITLSEEERNFQIKYQNYYGNFIRTGDPNNFTGNPSSVHLEYMETWQTSGNWFAMTPFLERTKRVRLSGT